MEENFFKNLNKPQQEAVKAFNGPFLVIAGAGSGKTTALTSRVVFLIHKRNISPFNIMAVTFTNKAASEMKQRISDSLGAQYSTPLIGTFHSVCTRILRKDIDKLNTKLTKDFTILDTQDTQAIIRRIIKKLNFSITEHAPRSVLSVISRKKNLLCSAQEMLEKAKTKKEEEIAKIYLEYQRELFNSNSLDFDDLIRLTVKLFEISPETLFYNRERFRYVLVDEYQDTNYAQYKFINILTKEHKNIFVVGDDWQSIYKWRGADVNNILNFEKDYPGASVIKLEQNYRSTQVILDTAHSIIEQNESRTDKKIWTDKKDGQKVTVFEAFDESQEAAYITKKILEEINKGNKQYRDFVVLYRTNAQSRIMEEYFLKNNIPYRIVGGIKFYNRKEIKDIIAYLKFIKNPYDQISFVRILTSLKKGIGPKTIESLILGVQRYNLDFLSFIFSDEFQKSVPYRKKQKTILDFANFIKNIKNQKIHLDVSKLISYIYRESGYRNTILDGTEEGKVKDENIKELLSVSSKYKGKKDQLDLFLEEISLASESDSISNETNKVHLMTLHSAKGLEFPIVFIVGLEEGLLPHINAIRNESELEEERRLLYVGITRAKEKVYLLHTNQRMLFGDIKINHCSRFLSSIPASLIEIDTARGSVALLNNTFGREKNEKKDIYKISKESQINIKNGTKVKHDHFGEGIVISSDEVSISIIFANIGMKKLSKEYAKLDILG